MGKSTDGDSDSMSWQEVNNKRKGRCDSSGSSNDDVDVSDKSKKVKSIIINGKKENEQTEWKVMITFKKEGGHFHPLKLTKAIEKEMGKIKFAKYLNNRRLLVFATGQLQRDRFLRAETLNGERISAHIPGNAAKLRGVIYDVPLAITMEEIIQEVKGGEVVKATRLQTQRKGVKTDSLSVKLEFEKEMPKRVRLGYLSYDVREFIPAPLRCFKCQRMGHTAGQCKGKQRCARCGGEHEYGNCGQDTKVKCCNCGGEHSAAFGGCPVQRQAREVQKYKVTNQVSYADAAKKVKESEIYRPSVVQVINKAKESENRRIIEISSPTSSQRQTEINPWIREINEDTLIVGKTKFIAFICKTVNVAIQQKKKSDRIKTIVEAAIEILGITEVTAEMIHEMLNPNNGMSQGD